MTRNRKSAWKKQNNNWKNDELNCFVMLLCGIAIIMLAGIAFYS